MFIGKGDIGAVGHRRFASINLCKPVDRPNVQCQISIQLSIKVPLLRRGGLRRASGGTSNASNRIRTSLEQRNGRRAPNDVPKLFRMAHLHFGENLIVRRLCVEAEFIALANLDPRRNLRAARASCEKVFRPTVFTQIHLSGLIIPSFPADGCCADITATQDGVRAGRDNAPFAEVAVGEAPSFASDVLERSHDAIIRLISIIKKHFMPGLRLARFRLVANVPSGARASFWSTMMPSCGTKSAFTHSSPRLAQRAYSDQGLRSCAACRNARYRRSCWSGQALTFGRRPSLRLMRHLNLSQHLSVGRPFVEAKLIVRMSANPIDGLTSGGAARHELFSTIVFADVNLALVTVRIPCEGRCAQLCARRNWIRTGRNGRGRSLLAGSCGVLVLRGRGR